MSPLRLTPVMLACSLTTPLFSLQPAAAQTPIIGFTPNAYGIEDNPADALGSSTGSFTLGFEFTANIASLVTSLGYFDDPSFNLTTPFNTVSLIPTPTGSYSYSQSHQVGLYQITNEANLLVASATITSSSTPNGDFLYQSITPVALVSGGDYVLAGVTGPTDPYVFNVEDDSEPGNIGVTTSGISYVQDHFDQSSTLALPTQTDPDSEPGFFGPNLISSPVPKGSSGLSLGLLIALGLCGIAAAAQTKQT